MTRIRTTNHRRRARELRASARGLPVKGLWRFGPPLIGRASFTTRGRPWVARIFDHDPDRMPGFGITRIWIDEADMLRFEEIARRDFYRGEEE